MKFFSATIAALACSSQVFGAPFERRDILSSVTAALNRELGHIRSEVSALSMSFPDFHSKYGLTMLQVKRPPVLPEQPSQVLRPASATS
jgi:hypothetical protein